MFLNPACAGNSRRGTREKMKKAESSREKSSAGCEDALQRWCLSAFWIFQLEYHRCARSICGSHRVSEAHTHSFQTLWKDFQATLRFAYSALIQDGWCQLKMSDLNMQITHILGRKAYLSVSSTSPTSPQLDLIDLLLLVNIFSTIISISLTGHYSPPAQIVWLCYFSHFLMVIHAQTF